MTGIGAEAALVGLGAVHGLNPGMGWLFAVALALQERSRRALWRALPPLALGHAGAIGLALAVAAGLGHALPPRELRWTVAVALVGLGVLRLVRHGHPRGSLRVNGRDLALWSLLMATAHGAGIMVLPLVLPAGGPPAAHMAHAGFLLAGVAAGHGVVGDHAAHRRLPGGHDARRGGGLRAVGRRRAPAGMGQPRPGVGRRRSS